MAAAEPNQERGNNADQQNAVVMDPEDRRPDQQVAQRSSADAVATAKKMNVTKSQRFSAATSAPEIAKTAIPK
jgi:hypothetical protein